MTGEKTEMKGDMKKGKKGKGEVKLGREIQSLLYNCYYLLHIHLVVIGEWIGLFPAVILLSKFFAELQALRVASSQLNDLL